MRIVLKFATAKIPLLGKVTDKPCTRDVHVCTCLTHCSTVIVDVKRVQHQDTQLKKQQSDAGLGYVVRYMNQER
jgi:hypothetical protein